MKKRHLKVNDDFYLVQEEVVQDTPETHESTGVPESGPTNHIFIYDRSGSMYSLIKRMVEDFIERGRKIPVGDTISIGWFSTQGQYNFILKGFKIATDSDYGVVESAIRQNNTTIGLTCFSEILHETADTLIKDLSIFSGRFALTFFTDGYPVVYDYNKEYTEIFNAINKLEKVLTSSLLVGYGNYYNKELMAEMALKLGGSLVHSADVASFGTAVENFIEGVQDTDNKIEVKLSGVPGLMYFGVADSAVVPYEPKDGVINFQPTRRGKNYLYIVTDIEPKNSECIKLVDSAVNHQTKIGAFLKGIYACAYLLVQRTKVADALELLGVLGDKSIIDSVANAFTNEEYGAAESRIAACIKSPNQRFLSGRDTSYLPAKDAFCVLDLVELLCSDPEAYFYPRHPQFKYNRIGAASVPQEGYPKFNADADNKCSFSTVSWNNTRMNLSVLMKLDGEIQLKKGFKKLGFSSGKYRTFVWRNYTLIKDGLLNVTKLPVSVSAATHSKLEAEGICELGADGVLTLDLTKIPVMNRAISEENTSAENLFKLSWESLVQKAKLKVFKQLKAELSPEEVTESVEGMSPEQSEFLIKHGVTNRGFAPPVEKIASTDHYFAKEFKIAIKKYSSLPSVNAVRKKIEGGKKLTPSDTLLSDAIIEFKDNGGGSLEWLDTQVEELTKQNKSIDAKIQRSKFGIILGNQWFDEFDSRENCTMELNGVQFGVSLDNKKIDI